MGLRRVLWKLVKWVVIPLGLLGVVAGGLFWAMMAKFYPDPPKADYPEPQSLVEAQAQDLDYFANFFDLDKSYSEEARALARTGLDELKAGAGAFSPAAFELKVAELVALADNGHSNAVASARSRRFSRIDVRTAWFDDGLYVLRAAPGSYDLLGTRLVSVDGVPVEALLEKFRGYYGGTPEFERSMAPYFIEAPELLEASGLPIKAEGAVYRFEAPSDLDEDGNPEVYERQFPLRGANPDDVRAFPADWLIPARKDKEPDDWRAFLDPASPDLPLYLQEPDKVFFARALPNDSYYIQLRQNYDAPDQKIKPFLKDALDEISALGSSTIILDFRFNGGGDYTTTAKAMWALPGLIPEDGRIYVISSAETFSAGMSSMGFVKEEGGDKVTIVGTEPGDRMQFWSEGSWLTLPNSGVMMHYSTGYVDMVNPCDDYSKCYWIGAFYPIEVESLSPDVEIKTNFADYAALRDPILDWIMAQN